MKIQIGGLGLLATSLLAVAKLGGYLTLSWTLVLLPVLLPILILAFAFLIVFVIAVIVTLFK